MERFYCASVKKRIEAAECGSFVGCTSDCALRLHYQDKIRPGKTEEKAGEPMKAKAETKVCSRCKKEKPVSEFTNKAATSDGLDPYCKPCKSKKMKAYRQKKAGAAPAAETKEPENASVSVTDGGSENILVIDFNRCPEMLSTLCAAAEQEFRTPELQVLYLIRESFTESEKGVS